MAVPRISKEELKHRMDDADPGSKPTILDARLKYPYEHSTVKLPGALRIPLDGLAQASLPRDKEVVAYDSDPNELASTRFAAALIRLGFRASALKGGLPEWMAANFPIETKEAPRQAAPEPGSLKG